LFSQAARYVENWERKKNEGRPQGKETQDDPEGPEKKSKERASNKKGREKIEKGTKDTFLGYFIGIGKIV